MVDQKRESLPARPNEDSIIGTWSPVWSRWEDIPTPAEDVRDVTLTFAEGRCEVRRRGKAHPLWHLFDRSGRIIRDDRRLLRRERRSRVERRRLCAGIYKLNAERLGVCYGPPGGDRAITFSADKGTGNYVAEYRHSDPTR